jgi:proteic killer suppression protein
MRSWRDTATRRFAESGKGKGRAWISKELGCAWVSWMPRKHSTTWAICAASGSISRTVPSGHWAIAINGPRRLVFRFHAGDAHDVEIVDYH